MQTATYKEAAEKAANKNATMDDVRNVAEAAKTDLRQAAYDTGAKVRRLFTNFKDEITDTTGTVTRAVRNKPVQSTLLALGAGFILGSLLRRG